MRNSLRSDGRALSDLHGILRDDNMESEHLCKLLDEVAPAGERMIDWPCMSDAGTAVAPGLYNAILDTPTGRQVTRLAIVP